MNLIQYMFYEDLRIEYFYLQIAYFIFLSIFSYYNLSVAPNTKWNILVEVLQIWIFSFLFEEIRQVSIYH